MNASDRIQTARQRNAIQRAAKVRVSALAQGYTEIQATIIEQLTALYPYFVPQCDVKAILNNKDGRGIRIHTKTGRRVVNVDITLDEGQDLYDVEAWEVQGVNVSKVKSWTGQFFTDLPGCLREAVSV